MKRRTALSKGLLAGAATGMMQRASRAQESREAAGQLATDGLATTQPVFIATWKFGKAACERSREVLDKGGSLRDAVERGINVTELDESNRSVGYGGLPNADGVVQLDACFMDGDGQQAGSVAAIEGYPNPISVARRVMESTRHVMLAGEDAAAFAKENGFASRDMLTPGARAAWEKWKDRQATGVSLRATEGDHDTIALLGVDAQGKVVGGCSTSGLSYKLPGRVGDSPIIGSGLYVDGQVGAAGATGVGENIMRYCGSFLIVELMRQGRSPTEACSAVIQRISQGDGRPPSELSVNFVAINKEGEVGAAGTDQGFRAAVVDTKQSLVTRPKWVRDR